MTVQTFVQPDYATQAGSGYPVNIDQAVAVMARGLGDWFGPHEQTVPDMTVRLDAGWVFDGTTLSEVAAQSTGTIAAPSTNPRIDRIVVDRSTGAVSVITGAEAASPSAPALTAGKYPVAQVMLQTSSSTITNSMITDERAIGGWVDANDSTIAKTDVANVFTANPQTIDVAGGIATLIVRSDQETGAIADFVLAGHNAASPAENINLVTFRGIGVDATDGSEDGRLQVFGSTGGVQTSWWFMDQALWAQGLGTPGAGEINATGYLKNGSDLPFGSKYESTNQTITAGGTLTLAHGLGVVPETIMGELECTTAEFGYAIGEVLEIPPGFVGTTTGAPRGVTIKKDATNVYVRFANGAKTFLVANDTNGNGQDLTDANWVFRAKAYAE